jgi:hypothetical protein
MSSDPPISSEVGCLWRDPEIFGAAKDDHDRAIADYRRAQQIAPRAQPIQDALRRP